MDVLQTFVSGLYVSDHPQVKTRYGVIQGERVASHLGSDAQVEQFLGIPFALPPVGERRFLAPEPPEDFKDGEKKTRNFLLAWVPEF